MRTLRLLSGLALALATACGGDDDGTIPTNDAGTDGGLPPGTYASAAQVFDTACSFSSCHGGAGPGAAGLNFQAARTAGTPYTEILVNQAACQYDRMDLVEPNDAENSWLYIKMAGPHMGAAIDFEPAADWEPAEGSTCNRTPGGDVTFGVLMPQGTTTPDARAAIIRAWIENGAPGPE